MIRPLEVVSVVDAVANDLRDRILSGELVAGTPLGEAKVSAAYDVSRPTARSAIDALVAARLLVRGAHKTARVTALTAPDVDDIYGARAAVESEVVRRLAAGRTRPSRADAANARIRELESAEPLAVVGPDMEFHRALVDAAGSERLSSIYALLADEVRLCMTQVQSAALLSTTDIAAQHARILDDISAGDAASATASLQQHLDAARSRLRDSLED